MTIVIDYLDQPYLEAHKPRRSQYRSGRRQPIRAVNVVHTGESGTDMIGPDPKAEAVARFIADRIDPGSYHLLGDADSAILMVDLDNEAFGDGTGSNPWAVHLALAMNSVDWSRLTPDRRDQFIETLVEMALLRAQWDLDNGREPPAPRRITKAASERPDASGFIAHGDRDPQRRSDPGDDFPWDLFLARYRTALYLLTATHKGPAMPTKTHADNIAEFQGRLYDLGMAINHTKYPTRAAYTDRKFGTDTLASAMAMADTIDQYRAEQNKAVMPMGSGALAADAANWRSFVDLLSKANPTAP